MWYKQTVAFFWQKNSIFAKIASFSSLSSYSRFSNEIFSLISLKFMASLVCIKEEDSLTTVDVCSERAGKRAVWWMFDAFQKAMDQSLQT